MNLKNPGKTYRTAFVLLATLLTLCGAIVLNSSGRLSPAKNEPLGLMSEFNAGVTGFSSESLDGIFDIKRVYVIPEAATVAPEPHAECYFSAPEGDYDALLSELEAAEREGLVNTSELAWNTGINTWKDTPVEYYHDSTAFVLMWRENIGKCVYNFAEVFIAHPSQFRRLLTDDTYGSNTRQTTTTMAKSCNALLGMSGDFYGYRSPGVVIYKGKLCKNIYKDMDTCFVDKNGDLILARFGKYTDEQLNAMIEEQDINFSLSFGPVLVENGETYKYFSYGFGEIVGDYARAGIGQIGKLHYLLCTCDGGVVGSYGTDIKTFASVIGSKNVVSAYTLDGGQTATIFYDNRIYNRVGYRSSERQISDIIYFATAN